MLEPSVLRTTNDFLQTVVTQFVTDDLLPTSSHDLFHYAALETIHKIIEFYILRLSHAEYSNDQTCLIEASDFAMTHCRRCAAGWTRTTANGAMAIFCLLDREPVPPNVTSCDRYELREQ